MKNIVWLVVLVSIVILAAILIDTLQGNKYSEYKAANDSLKAVNQKLSTELLILKIERQAQQHKKDSLLKINSLLIEENNRLKKQLAALDESHDTVEYKKGEAYTYLNIVYPPDPPLVYEFGERQVEDLYRTHLDKNYLSNRNNILELIVIQQDSIVDNLYEATKQITIELTNCDQQVVNLETQLKNKDEVIKNKDEEIKKRKTGNTIWKGISAALLVLSIVL